MAMAMACWIAAAAAAAAIGNVDISHITEIVTQQHTRLVVQCRMRVEPTKNGYDDFCCCLTLMSAPVRCSAAMQLPHTESSTLPSGHQFFNPLTNSSRRPANVEFP